jgi:aspartyl/glutamyl-tRNA(Asn/Gln) amidotransferase C subunit
MTEEIPLRSDLVIQDGSVEEILKNAPSQEQNLFLVPKIVE